MKIMLLCGLYLFFVRVLWSVFSELRDPRTVVRKQKRQKSAPSSGPEQSPVAQPMPSAASMPGLVTAGAPGAVGVAVVTPESLGQLRVIDPPELVGTTYQLGQGLTIGRAPTNGIHLDDTYVSTVHARIFATNGTYFVEDLDSRNGTLINAHALVATTALLPGDRLQIGAVTLEFA